MATPAALTTQNPALHPIISVVDKALANGMSFHLSNLYAEGYKEYLRNKIYNQFTPEERDYLYNNPVVPVLARRIDYPYSFYNRY
jgi:hypothetical protein